MGLLLVVRRGGPPPLNLFGIPLGVLGLGDCWLVAANFGLAAVDVGRLLVAVAVVLWALVGAVVVRGARMNGETIGQELGNKATGPFGSLIVITPMLAAADALYPLSHAAGVVVVDVGIAATVLMAGWLTGQLLHGSYALADLHPGYFLPSVAGGFIASASAGLVGQRSLAEALFGMGLMSWIVLAPVVLGRLIVGPSLPPVLLPTVALEMAPAGVATFAAFVIDGHRVDLAVQLLAGYGVLMVLAQVRMLSLYVRLSFAPSFWTFTFSSAAVTFASLFWLGVARPTGWRVESYIALVLITGLIGFVAVRTVVAQARGQFLPLPSLERDTKSLV
jgi:tellurite resistance protein